MVVKQTYFILFLLLVNHCFPQTGEITEKKSELSSIKLEISNLEQELADKSVAERKSFESIENLNKQSFLINKIIRELNSEIKIKDGEIRRIEVSISLIKSEIIKLKENYAKYVAVVYKKGKYNEIESLLNAESLQQALMRTYYFQLFSKRREKDLIKLDEKIIQLAETKAVLEKEKIKKLQLVETKDQEKQILLDKLNEKNLILSSIKKNKNELTKQIAAKKDAQSKIEKIIVQLIEEEKRRKEELERQKREQLASLEGSSVKKGKIVEENSGFEYDLSTSSFSSFSDLKGKMIWPLNKGKIIRKFGENKNKSLNTITLNYGVDIKADKDKNVRSVGEGVVAAIDWLPGYGNVVIVSHKDGYRTIYGHLSEIFVSEGDKVKTGSVLSIVDEGLDGHVLHFEIWKARDKQNPELWLAKK